VHFSNAALWVATAWLLAAGTPAAQVLTGTLYGRALDESGLPVPGVTVTISSPQLMQTAVRVTSEHGGYRVPNLPPGNYLLKAEIAGFQTMTRQDILLQAGAVLAIDFVLKVAALEETITVTGESPLVDVRSAQTQRSVEAELIENIPTRRAVTDILLTAPGIIDGEYGFTPAQSVQGSSVRENVYNVDGANVNDTTNGYLMTDFNYDVLQEVQVTTGGVSAEFGQGSGGVFNFITKSGGNALQGNSSLYVQNDTLEGGNVDDELRRRGLRQGTKLNQNLDYGASLGGPIIKDRVWFFGNIRRLDREEIRPDFNARDIRTDDSQEFIKVTTHVRQGTRLQGSFTHRSLSIFPGNASFATNNSPETWQSSPRVHPVFYLELTHVVSDATLIEGRFSQSFWNSQPEFSSDQAGYTEITTGTQFGGRPGVGGETTKRDNRVFKVSLSHFKDDWAGSHNFKGGFESLFSPFSWIQSIPGDTTYQLRNGLPYRIALLNTPVEQGTNVTRYAGFLQDEWTIKDRLTLTLGVRFESTEGWQPEQTGGGGNWFPLTVFPEVRDQIKWFNTAPRLGAVWDLKGDRRNTLKVTYGRYYAALFNTNVLAANRNLASGRTYDWNDLNRDLRYQPGEEGTLRSNTSSNLDVFDPDLKQAYLDSFTVGFDRELGTNMLLSVIGVFKRERDIMENVDIARPFSAYNSLTVRNPIDGQPLTIYALKPEFQSVQRVRMLTNPTNPVPLYRDYNGVEIVLRKRMSNNWQFQGSVDVGRSYGNIGNAFGPSQGGQVIYDNPNTLVNFEGPLDLDAPFQLKLQGTYVLPHGIALSAFYSGISAYPIKVPANFPNEIAGTHIVRFSRADNPLIVSESFVEVSGNQRGSQRFDFRNLLSFRAEKTFDLGRAQLGLIADVFNLLNINTVVTVQSQTFDQPNFLAPSAIERPIAARLGLRLNF
jgi:outer membrane receptor protein involved in Fe transport